MATQEIGSSSFPKLLVPGDTTTWEEKEWNITGLDSAGSDTYDLLYLIRGNRNWDLRVDTANDDNGWSVAINPGDQARLPDDQGRVFVQLVNKTGEPEFSRRVADICFRLAPSPLQSRTDANIGKSPEEVQLMLLDRQIAKAIQTGGRIRLEFREREEEWVSIEVLYRMRRRLIQTINRQRGYRSVTQMKWKGRKYRA